MEPALRVMAPVTLKAASAALIVPARSRDFALVRLKAPPAVTPPRVVIWL